MKIQRDSHNERATNPLRVLEVPQRLDDSLSQALNPVDLTAAFRFVPVNCKFMDDSGHLRRLEYPRRRYCRVMYVRN